MPWREPTVVDSRYELVMKHMREGVPVTELASRYGVSRKTVYKWIERFENGGKADLQDRSRTPTRCPQRISQKVQEILLEARRKHPHWGPRKILPWLARRRPELSLPAASTVGDLYRREGLSRSRRRRRDGPSAKNKAATQPMEPNSVWSIDYKGQFRTTDCRYCYPLTVVDGYSRYIVDVRALDSTCYQAARRSLERSFREHGLPEVILSDNGVPFAVPHAPGSLSRLAAWWVRLGIRHERIDPGHPEQNGSHERMHKTLKQETVRPPASGRRAQQRRFDAFCSEYNLERPHEALANRTPSELWTPSPRPYPSRLLLPLYPGHFEVRSVSSVGNFRFASERVFVGRAIAGDHVGLEEVDNDLWAVYFYSLLLCRVRVRKPLLRRSARLQARDRRYLRAAN